MEVVFCFCFCPSLADFRSTLEIFSVDVWLYEQGDSNTVAAKNNVYVGLLAGSA